MNKANSLFSKLCAPLFVFIILINTIAPVYALNDEYLSYSKFKQNGNITTKSFDVTSNNQRLYGSLEYFSDKNTLSLYTRFSVKEDNSKNDMENAQIIYIVKTPSEEYTISVGENGIENLPQKAKGLFEAQTNFSNAKLGELISAIQYKGKEPSCDISLKFYTNRTYKIIDTIHLELPATTSAKKSANQKTTKQAANKSAKTTTQKATKFVPKYNGKSSADSGSPKNGSSNKTDKSGSTLYQPTGTTENGITETQLYESEQTSGVTKRSKQSEILLIIGIILAILGVLAIIIAQFINSNNSSDEEGNKEADENE